MIYLVNYRSRGVEPLKSIMHLSEAEAMKLAGQLYDANPCPAHRRFGPDFPQYYAHRKKTEAWLYEAFVRLGGMPETHHPYYFAVERSESLLRNFGDTVETRLPLDDIDPAVISFTLGDSVAQMEASERHEPFTLQTFRDSLAEHNENIDQWLDEIQGTYKIIEAQVWSARYFNA